MGAYWKRERLLWALKPLLRINGAFGLASPIGRYGGQTGPAIAFYKSALYTVLTAATLPVTILIFYLDNRKSNSYINKFVSKLWSIVCVLGAVSGYTFVLWLKNVRKIFADIIHIEEKISNYKLNSWRALRRYIEVQSVFMAFSFIQFACHIYAGITASKGLTLGTINLFLAIFWGIVNVHIEWQLSCTVLLLCRCFENLNSEILTSCIDDDRGSFVYSKVRAKWDIVNHVVWLRKQQLFVYQISRSTSRAYGITNLYISFVNLLNVTSFLFFLIDYMMYISRAVYDFNAQILNFLWIVVYLVVLTLVLSSCDYAHKEADRTGVLVSEALLKVKDSKARRELRLFSQQLLHTKVRFTACGFFTLDFSLFTSMAAAIVTYLVILVQFQLSGMSNKNACNCIRTNYTGAKEVLNGSMYEYS